MSVNEPVLNWYLHANIFPNNINGAYGTYKTYALNSGPFWYEHPNYLTTSCQLFQIIFDLYSIGTEKPI